VLSSFGKPVSAKQNLSPPRPRGLCVVFLVLGFFLFLSFVPRNVRADSLEEAARSLARKVSSAIHASSVTCDFRNLSTLRRAEFTNLFAAFQEELQSHGVKLLAADGPVSLVVSVTQDPAEYIAIVQIQTKGNTETLMETIGPVDGPAAPEPAFSITLHREFLFSQNDPISDVVLDQDGKHAQVLAVHEVSAYELQGDRWELTGVNRLPRHRVPKRSDTGFLGIGIDSASAVFPEEICTVSLLPGNSGWECRKNGLPMGVRGVSQEAMAGKNLGAWISAAQIVTEGKTKIIVTGEDGLARMYEEAAEPVTVFPNWGSEIASVYSGCGSGWQLLVTGKGDWTKPDEIQAIDIQDLRAQTVSEPMEFPGPIIVLHTPGMTWPDYTANGQAVAADRNLQTGRYEAYLLSIACTK
jgi:hypothetical protein